MSKLPLAWSKGLSAKEKDDLEYVLRNNKILIGAFLNLLDQMEQEEARADTNLSEYDSPSWSHKQADRNGARRAYRKIKTLFTF